MKRYVCGFLFDDSEKYVALVLKAKPSWQKGRLNGIGGSIEDGETAEEAMRREFREEASVDIDQWERFAELQGDGFSVHFFSARAPKQSLVGLPDEQVGYYLAEHLPFIVIPNLHWLIPMGTDKNRHDWPFNITERAA